MSILLALLPCSVMAQQQVPAKHPVATGQGPYDKHAKQKVYRSVQQMAEFPGGAVNLQKFMKENLHYLPVAIKEGIEGKVLLQFVVDSTGVISNINVMKDIGGGCGKEAARLAKRMPRWRPAKQDGKPVSSYYSLPVLFYKSHTDTTAIKH